MISVKYYGVKPHFYGIIRKECFQEKYFLLKNLMVYQVNHPDGCQRAQYDRFLEFQKLDVGSMSASIQETLFEFKF